MHMLCQGERANSSSPIILLESMEAVGQALAWSAVLQAMEEYNLRVCAYDRRGYGWSSPLPFASSEAQKRGIKETVRKLPSENEKM